MTRAWIVLAGLSMRRARTGLLALGLMLAAFQFLLIEVGGYLFRRGAFTQLSALIPEFVLRVAGPEAMGFFSFSGVVSLGYAHPVVLTSLIGFTILLATEPAADVERRFVDLTLALPVARADVITRSVVVVLACDLAMVGSMVAGSWLGLTCCAPAGAERPSIASLASQAFTLLAVLTCWGAVALAAASAARRRTVAGSVAGGSALAAYLLDYLGQAWEPARGLSIISPFHYFRPSALLRGEPMNLHDITVLFAIASAGVVAGYVVFARRDI